MRFFVITCLLTTAFGLGAQSDIPPLVLDDSQLSIDATNHLMILGSNVTEKIDSTNIAELPYVPFEKKYITDPKGEYWLRLTLLNASLRTQVWHLDMGLHDQIEAYLMDDSGQYTLYKTGFFSNRSERNHSPTVSSVRLFIPTNDTLRVFVKVNSPFHGRPNFKWKLVPFGVWEAKNNRQSAADYMFQGFVWILAIFSFIIYLTTQDKSALYYSFYLVSLGVLFLYLNGIIRNFIPGDYPKFLPYLIISVPLSCGFYYQFVKHLVGSNLVLHNWNLWINRLVGLDFLSALVVASILTFSEDIGNATWFNISIVLLNALFLFPLLFRLFKSRDQTTEHFIIGTTIFIISVVVTVLTWQVGTSEAPLARLGLVVQIIFYSIGLGTRLRQHAKEKEQIREKLIEQMKQNEELSRVQNDRLEQEVKKRTLELERINEGLRAYDHMISHDLKSPIANLSMLVDLMQDEMDKKDSSGRKKILQLMSEASKRAIRLNDDVLAYATADKPSENLREVDLNDTLKEVLENFKTLILKNQAIIKTEKLPVVEKASAVKMYQLLQNLIGNALKFHESNTPPQVHISYSNHVICIEDNGIGFSLEKVEDIFKPLYRGYTNGVNYEGIGMGLATCKRICEFHGWKLQAESSPGMGSKFMIVLK